MKIRREYSLVGVLRGKCNEWVFGSYEQHSDKKMLKKGVALNERGKF